MDDLILQSLSDAPILDTSSSDSSNSSSSSSSFLDEDSELEIPLREKHEKTKKYFEMTVPSYSEADFRRHFRMTRNSLLKLCNLIELEKNYIGGWPEVSQQKAVHICVYYLANTNAFREVADKFDIARSTCFNIVQNITQKLKGLSSKYVKMPSKEELVSISASFTENEGLPFAAGAIDCTHLEIPKPKNHQEDYCNRKGFHSIILQAVVNNKKLFIDIYVGEPGSLHDARVLRKSPLYYKLENENVIAPYYFLADTAYPASIRWLVPPFRDNGILTNNQKRFNQRLSKKRIVVEHAFGLLKGRFRRLNRFNNKKIRFVVNCIVAAVVLHNLCIKWDDLGEDFSDMPTDLDDINVDDDVQLNVDNSKRQEIFEMLYN